MAEQRRLRRVASKILLRVYISMSRRALICWHMVMREQKDLKDGSESYSVTFNVKTRQSRDRIFGLLVLKLQAIYQFKLKYLCSQKWMMFSVSERRLHFAIAKGTRRLVMMSLAGAWSLWVHAVNDKQRFNHARDAFVSHFCKSKPVLAAWYHSFRLRQRLWASFFFFVRHVNLQRKTRFWRMWCSIVFHQCNAVILPVPPALEQTLKQCRIMCSTKTLLNMCLVFHYIKLSKLAWRMWFSKVTTMKRMVTTKKYVYCERKNRVLKRIFGVWGPLSHKKYRQQNILEKALAQRRNSRKSKAWKSWYKLANSKRKSRRKVFIIHSHKQQKLGCQVCRQWALKASRAWLVRQVWKRIFLHVKARGLTDVLSSLTNRLDLTEAHRRFEHRISDLTKARSLCFAFDLWTMDLRRRKRKNSSILAHTLLKQYKLVSHAWSLWRLCVLHSGYISSKHTVLKVIDSLLTEWDTVASSLKAHGPDPDRVLQRARQSVEQLWRLVDRMILPPIPIVVGQYELNRQARLPELLAVFKQVDFLLQQGSPTMKLAARICLLRTHPIINYVSFDSSAEGIINPPNKDTAGGIHISAKPAVISVHQNHVFSPISSSSRVSGPVSNRRSIVYSPTGIGSDDVANSPRERRNISNDPFKGGHVSSTSMHATQSSSGSHPVQRNLFGPSSEDSAQLKFQENPSNDSKLNSSRDIKKMTSEAPMVVLLGGPVVTSRLAPSLS